MRIYKNFFRNYLFLLVSCESSVLQVSMGSEILNMETLSPKKIYNENNNMQEFFIENYISRKTIDTADDIDREVKEFKKLEDLTQDHAWEEYANFCIKECNSSGKHQELIKQIFNYTLDSAVNRKHYDPLEEIKKAYLGIKQKLEQRQVKRSLYSQALESLRAGTHTKCIQALEQQYLLIKSQFQACEYLKGKLKIL